ncbi:class I tRNA ligase family protein [Candidatus Saccharibacteria bacterium]|nr:class I tRNA ligase family protein [Candidatus Saccharibacteria bacterium]
MEKYDPGAVEQKWQQYWSKNPYLALDFGKKPKFVMLTEFPYPSGDGLHLGHTREYTYGDIIARYKRLQGYNVMYPMGFDAFGLPTENYAIKNNITPQEATERNVATFTDQFKSLGYSFDWTRVINTTDPGYYKWTQWLFLQFYKHDMAYQEESSINWCPRCKTGLANEEVLSSGRHERCETLVEKKKLKQWMLRITKYADRLIEGLENVDYPSRIADQQVNWIGRSEGAEISFVVAPAESETSGEATHKIKVFTTRPDTICGASFLVLAPEHPLVDRITTKDAKPEVNSYKKMVAAKSEIARAEEKNKTGVFTGAYATNPISGDKMPIWIADYVLATYGEGAIMAVPAHDERDHEFASKYSLPIVQVVAAEEANPVDPPRAGKKNTKRQTVSCLVKHPEKDEYLTINWTKRGWRTLPKGGIEDGETAEEAARREITEETGYKNLKYLGEMPYCRHSCFYAAHKDINRDITTIYLHFQLEDLDRDQPELDEIEAAEGIEAVWAPRSDLSSLTPHDPLDIITDWLDGKMICHTDCGTMINSGEFDGLLSSDASEKIIAKLESMGAASRKTSFKLRDWIFSRQRYWGEPIPIIHCADCGAVPVPDKDLPVVLPKVDSYEPSDTGESVLASVPDWVNVPCPKCQKPAKRETDTMPNWAGSSWYWLRYFDAHNDQAFADPKKLKYWGEVDLYLGGMEHTTLHLLYSRFWHQFFYDHKLVPTPEPYAARRGQGIILASDGRKMSKSLGNVINPTSVINDGYGADALRLAIAFLAPFDQTTPWNPEGVAGTYRFLVRVWNLCQQAQKSDSETVKAIPAEGWAAELRRVRAKTVKKVRDDLDGMHFNTAVAALMGGLNDLSKHGPDKETMADFCLLLSSFAPHISHELYHQLTGKQLDTAEFPTYDEKDLVDTEVEVVIQINGKVRSKVKVPADQVTQETLQSIAENDVRVKQFIGSTPIKKTIVVTKNRLVNIVI